MSSLDSETAPYQLIFEGPGDESERTVQRIKGVFVADFEFPVEEVQRILETAPICVRSAEDESDLTKLCSALKTVGARVMIVKKSDSKENLQQQDNQSNSITSGASSMMLSLDSLDDAETLEVIPVKESHTDLNDGSESAEMSFEFSLDGDGLVSPEEKPKQQKVYTLDLNEEEDSPLFDTGMLGKSITLEPKTEQELESTETTDENPLSGLLTKEEKSELSFGEIFDSEPPTDPADDADLKELQADGIPAIDLTLDPIGEEPLAADPVDKGPTSSPMLEPPAPEAILDFSFDQPDSLNSEVLVEENTKESVTQPGLDNRAPVIEDLPLKAAPTQLSKDVEPPAQLMETPLDPDTAHKPAVEDYADNEDEKVNTNAEDVELGNEVEGEVRSIARPESLFDEEEDLPDHVSTGTKKPRRLPVDVMLPIVIGSAILIATNWFYFSADQDTASIASLEIAQELMDAATDEAQYEAKTIKKEPTINWGANNKYPGWEVRANFESEGTLFTVGKVEVIGAEPAPLTKEQIVRGESPPTWIRRLEIERIRFEKVDESTVNGNGVIIGYISQAGLQRRVSGQAYILLKRETSVEDVKLWKLLIRASNDFQSDYDPNPDWESLGVRFSIDDSEGGMLRFHYEDSLNLEDTTPLPKPSEDPKDG